MRPCRRQRDTGGRCEAVAAFTGVRVPSRRSGCGGQCSCGGPARDRRRKSRPEHASADPRTLFTERGTAPSAVDTPRHELAALLVRLSVMAATRAVPVLLSSVAPASCGAGSLPLRGVHAGCHGGTARMSTLHTALHPSTPQFGSCDSIRHRQPRETDIVAWAV